MDRLVGEYWIFSELIWIFDANEANLSFLVNDLNLLLRFGIIAKLAIFSLSYLLASKKFI